LLSKVVKVFLQTGHFFSIQTTNLIDCCGMIKLFCQKIKWEKILAEFSARALSEKQTIIQSQKQE